MSHTFRRRQVEVPSNSSPHNIDASVHSQLPGVHTSEGVGDPISNAAVVEKCPIICFWYVMALDSADLTLPLSKDLGAPNCDTVSDVMTLGLIDATLAHSMFPHCTRLHTSSAL